MALKAASIAPSGDRHGSSAQEACVAVRNLSVRGNTPSDIMFIPLCLQPRRRHEDVVRRRVRNATDATRRDSLCVFYDQHCLRYGGFYFPIAPFNTRFVASSLDAALEHHSSLFAMTA